MRLEPSEEVQQRTTVRFHTVSTKKELTAHKLYKCGERTNSVSCAVQVKVTTGNETDYEEGDDISKLGKWILHLTLNYFALTIN